VPAESRTGLEIFLYHQDATLSGLVNSTMLLTLGFRPVANSEPHDGQVEQIGRMPGEAYNQSAKGGDDLLAAAAGDGIGDLARGAFGRHAQPLRDGIWRIWVEAAEVVDLAELRGNEAGADEDHPDVLACELMAQRLSQSAQGELAHAVGGGVGGADMAGDAPDQNEAATVSGEFGQGGMNGAQDAKDIGFKLAPVIGESECGKRAGDAESRIGDGDINLPKFALGGFDGPFEVAVAGDIAGDGDSAATGLIDFGSKGSQTVGATGEEDEVGTAPGQFVGECRPNTCRGTRNEGDSIPELIHSCWRSESGRYRAEGAPVASLEVYSATPKSGLGVGGEG